MFGTAAGLAFCMAVMETMIWILVASTVINKVKETPVLIFFRRDLKKYIPLVLEEDPNAFYISEQARDVSKVLRPIYQPITGWRSTLKRK